MPVVSGKPGTDRIRGTTRGQVRQVLARMESFLRYQAKLEAKVPPVVFLNELNLAAVNACRAAMIALLAAKN